MKKIAIVVMSAAASMAMAMGTMTNTSSGESPVKIYTNIDMNMTKMMIPSTTTKMGYSLSVGTDAAYMFTNDMGASLGLDFSMLSGETSGNKSKVSYLDIPVNFVYMMSLTSDVSALVGVGPYIGMPIGKMDVAGTKTKVETMYGLNLESHVTYAMSSDFALGGHIGFKYAMNDMDKTTDKTQNYWALGLGVSAKFL